MLEPLSTWQGVSCVFFKYDKRNLISCSVVVFKVAWKVFMSLIRLRHIFNCHKVKNLTRGQSNAATAILNA